MLEDDRRASTSFDMSNKVFSVKKRAQAIIQGGEDNDDGEEHVRRSPITSSWQEGFHGGSWKVKQKALSRTSRKKSRLLRDFQVSNDRIHISGREG